VQCTRNPGPLQIEDAPLQRQSATRQIGADPCPDEFAPRQIGIATGQIGQVIKAEIARVAPVVSGRRFL